MPRLTDSELAETILAIRHYMPSSDWPLLDRLLDDLRAAREERLNFYDTMNAIAVKGLGLTDGLAVDAPDEVPEGWNRALKTDGLFSTAIQEIRLDRDQLRAEIASLKARIEEMESVSHADLSVES